MKNLRRSILLNATLIGLLLVTNACKSPDRTAAKLAEDAQGAQKFDSNLTFNNVTLEQANDKGQLWWRVKAKQAIYAKDQKNATVQEPRGELYQDGQIVFRIEAQKSEIEQDGKSIVLKGQITATDVRDGSVLKGNEVEWRPTEDILIVRNGFTGDHKQLQLAAKEGRYQTRTRKLDVNGQIVAQVKDPQMQIRTEHLVWEVQNQNVTGDRPVQIDRYENKQVSDRATADQANVDLKAKIATLRQNGRIMLNSGLQVSGDLLAWNVDQKTLTAAQPVTIVNPAQQITLTADSGTMQLAQQIANLNGNVRGVGGKNQSQLSADRVTWFLTTQQFQANGNVNYRQSNPPFSLNGPQASGKLDDQQVAVDGGRVELQITPQGRGQ